MFEFPAAFILFDLEYTAEEDSREHNWSRPGEHREVIQVGAIRVEREGLREVESLLEYVRPTRNPKLSAFIIELTGISQNDVETKGISYQDAYAKLKAFVGSSPAFCWGKDIEVLEENNDLNGAPETLPRTQWQNIRPLMAMDFAAHGVDIEKHSSGTLIQGFGEDTGLRAHDAVNDMRNLLAAIRVLTAKSAA